MSGGLVTHSVRPIYQPRYAPYWFYARPKGQAKWTRHSYATPDTADSRAVRLRELGYEVDPYILHHTAA